jgi:hypothetical protein
MDIVISHSRNRLNANSPSHIEHQSSHPFLTFSADLSHTQLCKFASGLAV